MDAKRRKYQQAWKAWILNLLIPGKSIQSKVNQPQRVKPYGEACRYVSPCSTNAFNKLSQYGQMLITKSARQVDYAVNAILIARKGEYYPVVWNLALIPNDSPGQDATVLVGAYCYALKSLNPNAIGLLGVAGGTKI